MHLQVQLHNNWEWEQSTFCKVNNSDSDTECQIIYMLMFLWPMLENVIVCFSYLSLQNIHGYYMDPWETCSFLGVWSVLLEMKLSVPSWYQIQILVNFFFPPLTSIMFIWIVHMWARIWSIWFCHPLCNSASLMSHEALKRRHDSIQASLSFFFLFSFWNGEEDYDPVVVKGQKQVFFLRHLDNFICYSFQPKVASLLRCRPEGITAVHFSGKQEGFLCVWKSMLTKAEGTILECQATSTLSGAIYLQENVLYQMPHSLPNACLRSLYSWWM